MFRRDIKKQFNENKYNVLTRKGIRQSSQLHRVPFHKHAVGTFALVALGFNVTKRWCTFPHHHKDQSKPMLLFNGELAPYENQPKGATDKHAKYEKHIM